jgi:hypothetical protein
LGNVVGTATATPSRNIEPGQEVVLTATLDDPLFGSIVGWSVLTGGSVSGNRFIMPAEHVTLRPRVRAAMFAATLTETEGVTVAATDAGATAALGDDGVAANTPVSFRAEVAPGYTLDGWSVTNTHSGTDVAFTADGANLTFTMPAGGATITPIVSWIPYLVTIIPDDLTSTYHGIEGLDQQSRDALSVADGGTGAGVKVGTTLRFKTKVVQHTWGSGWLIYNVWPSEWLVSARTWVNGGTITTTMLAGGRDLVVYIRPLHRVTTSKRGYDTPSGTVTDYDNSGITYSGAHTLFPEYTAEDAATGDGAPWDTDMTYTAPVLTGWTFRNWTKDNGSVASTDRAYSFRPTSSYHLTANYDRTYYKITTALKGDNGNPSGSATYSNTAAAPSGSGVVHNTSLTVTAPTIAGWKFIKWTNSAGTQVSTSTAYTFNVTSNNTLTANYEKLYKLNVDKRNAPSVMSLTPVTGNYYAKNAEVTINSVGNLPSNQRLVKWTLTNATRVSGSALTGPGGSGVTSSIKVKITGAGEATVEALYEAGWQINTAITPSGSGSVAKTANNKTYYWNGEELTLKATPAAGYKFVRWNALPTGLTLKSGSSLTNATITVVVTAARTAASTITANFETTPPYTVIINGREWAGSNLAGNGVFAANDYDRGALFQWGKNVAYTITSGSISNWPAPLTTTGNANTQWPADADPCPGNWRVPAYWEFESDFININPNDRIVVTKGGKKGIEVYGKIFWPYGGRIDEDGNYMDFTSYDEVQSGFYWGIDYVVSYQIGTSTHVSLGWIDYSQSGIGQAIRCVRTAQ